MCFRRLHFFGVMLHVCDCKAANFMSDLHTYMSLIIICFCRRDEIRTHLVPYALHNVVYNLFLTLVACSLHKVVSAMMSCTPAGCNASHAGDSQTCATLPKLCSLRVLDMHVHSLALSTSQLLGDIRSPGKGASAFVQQHPGPGLRVVLPSRS